MRPKRQKKTNQIRQDGFVNTFLGNGLHRTDPLANTRYAPELPMSDWQLASLYTGNALVRRIVDLPADEAVKNWINIIGDEENEYGIQMLDDLGAEEIFSYALRWSRLFGGSAVLMTIDDGGTLEDEVNEDNIRNVESLKVFDKREVILRHSKTYDGRDSGAIINDNPQSLRYGMPEWIQVQPATGTMFYVHHSRILIFDGDPIPNQEREQRSGWGLSSVQGLFNALAYSDDVHRISRLIMERLSQSVTKFEGLIEKLATDQGEKEIQIRLHLIDMARSILNTVAIDKNDEFQLHNISLTNIPELIDRFGMFVAVLANIPYTILFGRNTGGLSANDNSQLENFYNFIRGRLQKRRLKPNLDKLMKYLILSKDGLFRGQEPEKWAIEFSPLWLPTARDEAETRKLNTAADKDEAEAAAIYFNMNALDSSEMRKKLMDDGKYPIDESVLDLTGEPEEETEPEIPAP